MGKKRKQAEIKTDIPEEGEKKNELMLEEELNISGKDVENTYVSPPAKLTRSSNKVQEKPPPREKKMNTKKTSVCLPSSPPSKLRKITNEEKVNAEEDIKISTSEKGVPVPNFPDGWRRQVVVRKTGKTAGQIDIYFYSPEGTKLRSRPDVAAYLAIHKSELKVEAFDFRRTLKTSEIVEKKDCAAENGTAPRKESKSVQCENSDGVELKDSPEAASSVKKSRSEKSSESNEEVASEETGKSAPEEKGKSAPEEKGKSAPEEKGKSAPEEKGKSAPEEKGKSAPEERKNKDILEEEKDEDEKKSKNVSRRRKLKIDVENTYVSPPAKLTRSSNKIQEKPPPREKKTNTKKTSAALSSSPPSKLRKITNEERVNVDDIKISTSEKGVPVPDGWRRQVAVRRTGKTAGQIDIYFYSPDGTKLRSRLEVANYLLKHKSALKVEDFDFSKPLKEAETVVKVNNVAENSTAKRNKSKNVQDENPWKNGVELEDSPKAVSTKMSRPVRKFPSKVPPPAGAKEKSDKKDVESKLKKSRK
ncbi:Methyl-CpG-binding domain protein 4 like protein [Argiope bruennichi]|uniref:Methyl-CpG-binding domain protein 4 like protein n=1 Tax=Argiope bruennichi TaxID=94029 RepID=A0A8T0FI30_ARGBR|nr:Methyl-CpG-binding domain protein 4 like protein [Argiope bruennichi]